MKNIFTLALTLSLFTSIKAQTQIEITPSAGYLLNGRIQFTEGVIDIENQPSFGITIGKDINNSRGFELDYTWASKTDLEFESNFPLLYSDFRTRVDIHNISLSYVNYFVKDSQLRPFLNVGAGASIFNVESGDIETRLSFNLGLGLKYDINHRLGIKIQARYMAPVLFEGAGIYAGIGTGGSSAGLSLNASIPMSQLDFRGGIIFKLGNY